MPTSTAAFPDHVLGPYRPDPRRPRIVDVPEISVLAVDGAGDPATAPEYTAAVETLYAVSYAIRAELKRAGLVYSVMPLEGTWSADLAGDVWADRDAWQWTMQIAQPDAVTPEVLERAKAGAREKRPAEVVDRLRFERVTEGPAAQILHVGPYGEAERPSVEALHTFIAESGRAPRGRHHEIYLSDARRTAPERLRTILRQPVA